MDRALALLLKLLEINSLLICLTLLRPSEIPRVEVNPEAHLTSAWEDPLRTTAWLAQALSNILTTPWW